MSTSASRSRTSGQPSYPGAVKKTVLALTVSPARRVTAIDVIADPDRLRRLRLAILPG